MRAGLVGRVFRLLLFSYPARFRRRFRSDMCALFRDRYSDVLRLGPGATGSFLVRTAFDMIRTGLLERWASSLEPASALTTRPKGDLWMRVFLFDLRQACRLSIRRPAFVAGAVATLALGIGANTAVFSVLRGVVLQPLPYDEPAGLVSVGRQEGQVTQNFTYFHLQDWRQGSTALSGISGFTEEQGAFSWPDGSSEHLNGSRVTFDVFRTLGIEPRLGRHPTAEEDKEGGPRVVVLSNRLWKRWGSRADIVGSRIRYEGRSATVIGVMPPGFYFPSPLSEFWIPLQESTVLREAGIANPTRDLSFIGVVARLADGSSLRQAQVELQGIEERIVKSESSEVDRPVLTGLHEAVVGEVRPMLAILQVAAALVLLVACANVSNLLLARASGRQREIAIRRALGAGRRHLFGQLLAESTVLTALGGLGGVLLGWGLQDWLLALGDEWIVRQNEITMDWMVLGFSAAIAAISIFAVGLSPAAASVRRDLNRALGAGSRSGTSALGSRLRQGLTVAQMAVAVVLLISAGLLARSFVELTSMPTGFEAQGRLAVRLSLPASYQAESALAFYDQLTQRLERMPTVGSVSVSNALPFGGSDFRQLITLKPGEATPEESIWAKTVIAAPGYFLTLGVPRLAGRDFDSGDGPDDAPVAVVNEVMAQQLWPDSPAVGQRFRRNGGISGSIDTLEYFRGRPWITVVGVVADERRDGFGQQPPPSFYIPHTQMPWKSMAVAIEAVGDPLNLVAPLRSEIASIDPEVSVTQVGLLGDRLASSVATERLRFNLIGLFALTAGLLATIGVYGVMAFVVAQRRREIGIRMALGAARSTVLRQVLRQGLTLAGAGTIIGLAVSLATSRLLDSMLFGISASDPTTYFVAVAVLVVAAVAACYGPARRASGLDPLEALRSE